MWISGNWFKLFINRFFSENDDRLFVSQKEVNSLTSFKSSVSAWTERWFWSTNAKDIGTFYLIFALFSGLLGTAFSVLIRMELSGPGVQYIADNQLYNSIITAHAILMIFFMVKKKDIFNSKSWRFCFSYCAFSSTILDSDRKKKISKVNINDNNNITIGNNNNNNDNQNNKDSKYKYVKILVNDPFNNRDIILKVTKKQKGALLHTINSPIILNPYCVTGFCDAEACFGIRIRKNSKLKVGWEVIPYFSINLHRKDIPVLLALKDFFGVGNISCSKETGIYQVNSIKDILDIILPHFLAYPLLTQKKADLYLFKLAIELIKNKEHKTLEGIEKLINIKASLNKGILNDNILSSYFKNIVPYLRAELPLPEVINPYWFAGFASGDGSFSVEILKSSTHKSGYQIIIKFLITQHSRDVELLRSFISLLGGGFVKERANISEFRLVKLSLITNKLVPFFYEYPIIGNKHQDFLDFCKIAELMNNNAHKTTEGLELIRLIKSGMNRGRNS